jgi:hypothetical protein
VLRYSNLFDNVVNIEALDFDEEPDEEQASENLATLEQRAHRHSSTAAAAGKMSSPKKKKKKFDKRKINGQNRREGDRGFQRKGGRRQADRRVERIAAVVEENKVEIAGLEDKIDEAEMDNWEAQQSIAQLEDATRRRRQRRRRRTRKRRPRGNEPAQ